MELYHIISQCANQITGVSKSLIIPLFVIQFYGVNRLTRMISSKYMKKIYSTLSMADKEGWCSRGSSTYHAILVTALCGYSIIRERLYIDKANAHSELAPAIIIFSMAYMIADILNEIRCYYLRIGYKVSFANIIHHLVTIISMISFLYPKPERIAFVAMSFLATEVTTPLVNLRWFILKSGYANTNMDIMASLSMLSGWILGRMTICYQILKFITIERHTIQNLSMFRMISMYSITLVMSGLNTYWLYLMLYKGYKSFQKHYSVTSKRKKAE